MSIRFKWVAIFYIFFLNPLDGFYEGLEKKCPKKKYGTRAEIPEFLYAAEGYEYTRQAAFYLDATSAATYRIIGITKTTKPKILELVFDRNEPRIQAARARYQFILQKALALGILP